MSGSDPFAPLPPFDPDDPFGEEAPRPPPPAPVAPAPAEPPPDLATRVETLALGSEVRRLVVLGDPHGDVIGFEEAWAREARPGTAIVSAGDNIGYADAAISSHFCALLRARGVRSVLGNHEVWSWSGRLFLGAPGGPPLLTPDALEWIHGLPFRLAVQAALAPELALRVVHTLPDWAYVSADSAERLLALEGADVVFCGHTHRPAIYALPPRGKPRVRRLDPAGRARAVEVRLEPGVRLVVDAGSLGRPSRAGRGLAQDHGTYAVLDLERRTVSLQAIDKRPRTQALLRKMLERPPG